MIGYFNDSNKTQFLGVGSVYKAQDGNIYKREVTDEDLLSIGKGMIAEKKKECKEKILANYSESDQRNILMSGDTTAISTMNTFIQAMITEYQTNGKNADYSNINP